MAELGMNVERQRLWGLIRSAEGPNDNWMLERDMEDLIARFPDDFFPGRRFELKGRQQSFAGVGRFDLLFEDRFQTKILMELKAGPAKYEAADQLARYKDELRNRGESNVLMWLVAPQVPHSIREFLDRAGIEYSEIHVAEFQRVADRHNAGPLLRPAPLPAERIEPQVTTKRKPRKQQKIGILEKARDFIKLAVHQVWDEEQRWATRDELAEQINKQDWAAERLDADGLVDLEERQKRVGNWVDWFSAYYTDGKHGLKDEFEQQEVNGKWAYRPVHGSR
jgi:hypothetical protein